MELPHSSRPIDSLNSSVIFRADPKQATTTDARTPSFETKYESLEKRVTAKCLEIADLLESIQNADDLLARDSDVRKLENQFRQVNRGADANRQRIPASADRSEIARIDDQLKAERDNVIARMRREIERISPLAKGRPELSASLERLRAIDRMSTASNVASSATSHDESSVRRLTGIFARRADLRERAKHYFTFGNPADGLDCLKGDLLTDDGQQLLEQMRWCPALERPVVSLSWGFGAETTGYSGSGPKNLQAGGAKSTRRGKDVFAEHRLSSSLQEVTGDVGKWVGEGLQLRLDNENFGQWGQEWKRWTSERRGITLVDIATQDQLLAESRGERLDLLATVSLDRKTGDGGKPVTKMVLRLHNVETGRLLWDSKPLTDVQAAASRRRGKDLSAEVVEQALAYIDENVTLKEVPDSAGENATERLKALTSGKRFDRLSDLLEIRYYQLKKILGDEEAAAAFEKILGAESGKQLATGAKEARYDAVSKLLPAK